MAIRKGRRGDTTVRDRCIAYYSRLSFWHDFGRELVPESERTYAAKIAALESGEAVIVLGATLGMQYDHSTRYLLDRNNAVHPVEPAPVQRTKS